MTFKELKIKAKDFKHGETKIAVAGDVATQFMTTALKGALAVRRVAGEVFEAPYNQVQRQVSIEGSELRQFKPKFVVLWESVEHWWSLGESVTDRIARVKAMCESFPGTVLYINAAPYIDGVYGSYPSKDSFAVHIRKFNTCLDELAGAIPNLGIVDLNNIVSCVGRNSAYDASMFFMSDMPLVPDIQALLAERVADSIAARLGQVKKCVIVDLDNTLWGGVVGEDGVEGIHIGEDPIGKIYLGIQRWLLRLKKRGIILAVCSKNDDHVAREVFDHHPDMLLRYSDFACFVANWKTKADNIAYIKQVLNIGFDSMIFLDDNPAEREIVHNAYPDVIVPELPKDPASWLDYIANLNCFETATSSKEDADRTRQYQEEAKRVEYKETFKNVEDYLESLEMQAKVFSLDSFTIPRVAQLMQRTNQFNLRTVRHSAEELNKMAAESNFVPLVIRMRDKFGDYGIVSVIIGKQSGCEMFIDTWLMSCRVLGRGLEWFALDKLVSMARERGVTKIIGEYIPTRKNGQVADLYKIAGFEATSEGLFSLQIQDYNKKETKIHEE